MVLLVGAVLFARPQIHNLMRGRMPFQGTPQKPLPERAAVQPKPGPVAIREWPTDLKPQDVLTNDTIVELLKSGMGAKLVSQLVQELPNKFDTSPAALIRLKQSNVPDELIETMISVNSRTPRPMATPAH
jgi:hypothetical protein